MPRHPAPHDVANFVVAVERAFGVALPPAERARLEDDLDLERSLVIEDDGELVATLSAYRLECCLPGGRLAGAVALTDVGVVPSARGVGHFRALVETFLAESHERREPLALLNADQAALYPRFGFGMASALVASGVSLPPGPLAVSVDDGDAFELRMLSPEEAASVAPALWRALRTRRVGEVSRTDSWWTGHFAEEARSPDPVQHLALARGDAVEGYLTWTRHEHAPGSAELVVRELDALDDAAERALVRFLLGRRDATRVRFLERPLDDPLPAMLLDLSRRTVEAVRDQLWLRLVDVETALGWRGFGPGAINLEVEDRTCPWNAGVWAIQSDGVVTEVGRGTSASARLGVDALAALYLGGATPAALCRAGRLAIESSETLLALEALFRAERAPFCQTVL